VLSRSQTLSNERCPDNTRARALFGTVVLLLSLVLSLGPTSTMSPRSTDARWQDATQASGNFNAGTVMAPVIDRCRMRGALVNVRTDIVWYIPGEVPKLESMLKAKKP
jgi:hypothetical protein